MLPAREESDEGHPEGASGEAVDDKVDARVQHQEEVVDAVKRRREWNRIIVRMEVDRTLQ